MIMQQDYTSCAGLPALVLPGNDLADVQQICDIPDNE